MFDNPVGGFGASVVIASYFKLELTNIIQPNPGDFRLYRIDWRKDVIEAPDPGLVSPGRLVALNRHIPVRVGARRRHTASYSVS